MAFVQVSGPVECIARPKTASTALATNSIVTLTTGRLVAATSSTLSIAGIMTRAVTSADSDYAGTQEIMVIRPHSRATFLALTANASATTHVGNSYDLTDAVTVNLSGNSYKQVTVLKVIDSTHVIVKFNEAVVSLS